MAKLRARVELLGEGKGRSIQLEDPKEMPPAGTELYVERRPSAGKPIQIGAYVVFWIVCVAVGLGRYDPMPALDYYNDEGIRGFITSFTMFGFTALALTAVAAFPRWPLLHGLLWLSWVCIPPTWFMIEYYWWFGSVKDGCFDRFKHGQQVATAMWAAGVAITSGRILRDK